MMKWMAQIMENLVGNCKKVKSMTMNSLVQRMTLSQILTGV